MVTGVGVIGVAGVLIGVGVFVGATVNHPGPVLGQQHVGRL